MISWMITGLAKLLPWRDSTIVRTATKYTDTDTEICKEPKTYPSLNFIISETSW